MALKTQKPHVPRLAVFIPVLALGLFASFRFSKNKKTADFAEKRRRMVKYQIKRRGIDDKKVLKAMRHVPRHKFVPKKMTNLAYKDRPLPIGQGQTISQPYIVALMTSLLKIDQDSKVLEIGTGSGYQAAVLAEITKTVYTIEIREPLQKVAEKRLKQNGYDYVKTKLGDGFYGWKDHAPFDAIVVTAAPQYIPPPLIKQLKSGGTMIIPVGPAMGSQKLYRLRKKADGQVKTDLICRVRFVPFKTDQ